MYDLMMSDAFTITTHHSLLHSVLKLFTGLAIAAFIAWKLMVAKATTNANSKAIANTHQ